MKNSSSSSPWHTRFEDEDPVDVVDPATVDYDDVSLNLIEQGCGPLDFADIARRGGWTTQRLIHALQQGGSPKIDIVRAVKHLNDCAHEAGGDIGQLPTYPAHRPGLLASDDDIVPVLKSTWDAIKAANDPRQFFNHGGQPVWIKASRSAPATIEPITRERMRFLMGQVGDWFKLTQSGRKASRPPTAVADHLVADPHPPLPQLNRLVSTPVFDGNGRLVARAGFHEKSGLFVATRNLVVPRVAHVPSAAQITRAKDILLELVQDFPFVDVAADRANALDLLILPFVRDLIDGPTPLHLITKPTAGTGGTLLAEALLYPALGRTVEAQTVPNSESEIQRRITSALMLSPEAILLDNLRAPLDSAHIASALTAATWRDREIRTSKLLDLPIRNVWVATGNNAAVSEEIARRTIPIRLDLGMERPWDRTDFRHKKLIKWTAENRERLIWAALTLAQAWVAEGMPEGRLSLGKYESWASVMSGIFEVVGIPGLLDNRDEWFSDRPSTEHRNRKVVAAWVAEFGDAEVKAGQLLPVLGPVIDIDMDPDKIRSSVTMLGGQLKKLDGQVVDGVQIVGRDVSGSMSWRAIRRTS